MHLQAKEGLAFALPDADVRQLGGILQRKGYKVFLRGPSMYAFKGLAGKLGPIGVHAAMLLVMAGMAAALLCNKRQGGYTPTPFTSWHITTWPILALLQLSELHTYLDDTGSVLCIGNTFCPVEDSLRTSLCQ